jgi:hypothetical protein
VWSRDFFRRNIPRRSKACVRPEEILELNPRPTSLFQVKRTVIDVTLPNGVK